MFVTDSSIRHDTSPAQLVSVDVRLDDGEKCSAECDVRAVVVREAWRHLQTYYCF